jgi:DNA primase
MLVEFALFDQDTFLERSAIRVTTEAQCAHLDLLHVAHQLRGDAAKIVLSSFAPAIGLKTVNLHVPVHQSADWESIELAKYTFAFRCSLDA